MQLDIVPETEAIRLPPRAQAVRVLRGGPVETGRGFVLHSSDYGVNDSTVKIGDVCLTATIDILRAIAKGTGPAQAVLALGYAGWASGQLESEILANGWLTCPADPASSSTPISTANMTARWRSSASTKGCCPPTPATPDPHPNPLPQSPSRDGRLSTPSAGEGANSFSRLRPLREKVDARSAAG